MISLGNIGEILSAKDRTKAGITAPAHGLFLTKIFYNE
jgi:tRNA U38,U39,U40 pseudouridine synthase TruA